MKTKSLGLAWIVVKDFKKAVKFYTEVVGLQLKEMHEEWGWAELGGHDSNGALLGIAVENPQAQSPIGPGQNAVLTFTVANLETAIAEMKKQKASIIGNEEVIPGHVKMQTVKDADGNIFQMVELLT